MLPLNHEGSKPWQKFGMDLEVMTKQSTENIEKVETNGGVDADLVAISMTGAMMGLAKMRSKAIYAGDEQEFDAMLDRFHSALEVLRILP